MTGWMWSLARWLEDTERWRIPVMGVTLLVLLFGVLAVRPAQQTVALLQAEQAQLASRLDRRQAALPPPRPETTLATLVAQLPSYRAVPEILSRIFAHARELEVVLDIGDYRYQRNKGEPYGRYQIELPVSTDYATLRMLVARLSNDLPYAAIEDIQITREDVGSDVIEARLRLALFLREQE